MAFTPSSLIVNQQFCLLTRPITLDGIVVSPEERFLNKVWSNKYSRRFMIGVIILQGLLVFITAGKEIKSAVTPLYNIFFSAEPSKNESKNIRHAFYVGYYSIELLNEMKSGNNKDWQQIFNSFKRRIEASLIALNYKELKILESLNYFEPIKFFDQMSRFRILSEGYFDSMGQNELSAYLVGVNFSILLQELSEATPSQATLNLYT